MTRTSLPFNAQNMGVDEISAMESAFVFTGKVILFHPDYVAGICYSDEDDSAIAVHEGHHSFEPGQLNLLSLLSCLHFRTFSERLS